MNLDFSTLYALWATDFFQKNEILLLCFGVIILLLLVIMIVVSINKTKRLKTLQQLNASIAVEGLDAKKVAADYLKQKGWAK